MCVQVNFGDVQWSRDAEFPRPARVGALRGVHGVASDPVVVVDAQTLLVPNFSYDGEAPGMYCHFVLVLLGLCLPPNAFHVIFFLRLARSCIKNIKISIESLLTLEFAMCYRSDVRSHDTRYCVHIYEYKSFYYVCRFVISNDGSS